MSSIIYNPPQLGQIPQNMQNNSKDRTQKEYDSFCKMDLVFPSLIKSKINSSPNASISDHQEYEKEYFNGKGQEKKELLLTNDEIESQEFISGNCKSVSPNIDEFEPYSLQILIETIEKIDMRKRKLRENFCI